MLKKTIKFEDLDGNPLVEDFYFSLSKAEIAEMELREKDGLGKYLEKIVKEEDREKLITLFKEILTKSVGRRSEDGRRFIKNKEITDDFVQSDAYSEMFIELVSDAQEAVKFVTGIVPASMQEAVADAQKNGEVALPAGDVESSDPTPAWLREGRTPTPDEVKRATPEQLQMAFQRRLSASEMPPTSTPA